MNFTPGQVVRVNHRKSMADRRIARIIGNLGPDNYRLEFVDSLELSEDQRMYCRGEYLTVVEGIPNAGVYLIATIVEYNSYGQMYTGQCLAHGSEPNKIADTVAQHWYPASHGVWDEREHSWRFPTLGQSVEVQDYEEICVGDYALMRNWLKDCTPGYSHYTSNGEDNRERVHPSSDS